MANPKEYSLLYKIGAQIMSSFGGSFRSAQQEIVNMQKELQTMNKIQSDISSYQKQQTAIDSTKAKLQLLQKQYDNLQNEQKENGDTSSTTANKLLAQEYQIQKTSTALENQTAKLQKLSDSLRAAGVNMEDLSGDSAKLTNQINALRAKQEEAAEEANNFGAKASSAFGAVQDALVTAGITVALQKMYDYFKSSADAAAEFQFALAKIQTVAGAGTDMQQISDDMAHMSVEMGKSATELSEASYEAISSGIDAAKAAEFTNKATELAIAGFTDSATSVDILTTIINAYGKSVADVKQISDELITVQNLGKTTVDRLASSMGMVIPTAAAYKVSLEDVNAAYALMTIQGVSTERTTTYLNSMFNELGDSSSKVSKALDEMTGGSFAELMASGRSLGDVLNMISEEVNGNVTAFANLWGSQEAQRAALSLLNVGSEEYNGTLQQMKDSAGATEKAYKIMADTAVMAQKRYEESANSLKLAIGESLSPALNELREMGTEAFGWATEFAKENPTVIKVLAAVAAEVGVVAFAVGAYNTVTKVSTTLKALNTIATAAETAALGAEATAATGAAVATTAFNTALKVNPIVAVVSVVATLTAGIIALTEASKANADESLQLTAVSREQYREMRELQDEYNKVRKTMDETSSEVQVLKKQLDEATRAYEDNKQTAEELDQEQKDFIDTHNKLMKSYEESISGIDKEARSNENLMNKLEELMAVEGKTASTKQEILAIVDLLNEAMPQLGLAYDQYADSLNMTADAIEKVVEAEIARDRNAANYAQLKKLKLEEAEAQDILKKRIQETAAEERELAEAQAAADAKRKELGTPGMSEASGRAYAYALLPYIDAVSKAQYAVEDATEAEKEAQAVYDKNQEEIKELTEALAGYSEEVAKSGGELRTVITDVTEKMSELAAKYDEAYKAALDSIEGQYSLWEEAAKVVATSSETMNSALESQTTYWQKYNENLANLSERGKDIEGLSDLLASFADGSTDSVNAVAGMAKASDEDLKAMVKNWQSLREEQKTVSENLANLRIDFEDSMNALQKELETTIANMELGDEAAESGKKTMEGFIKGAEDMLPEIQAAYARIAAAANEAMATASGGKVSVSYGVDGSHAAGLDYVPYDGYIAQLHQGERILTANEASAYSSGVIETTAIQAESSSGVGSSTISPTFNVTYNVSGNNAEEVVSGIARYDNELKEFIIEAIEDTENDRRRGSFHV